MKHDLLVIANPVWEVSWLTDRLPVDRFDPDSRLEHVEDGGGSALNTACALAQAGWRVVAVGRVGDDREGRACVEALARRGIDPWIEFAPGRTTKRNHLYVERGTAATAFETTLPERSAEPWEENPPELLEARFLLLDRLAARAVDWLIARRRDPLLQSGLNRNTPGRDGLDDPRLRAALSCLDYLQLPERAEPSPEIQAPAAPPHRIHRPRPFEPLSPDQVGSLLRAGTRILVRTRGVRGAIIHAGPGSATEIPAVPTAAIDPTGAGDAFAAGFLDRLLRGSALDGVSLREAGARGAEWAARACRHLGARGWLEHEPPERDQAGPERERP